MSVIGFGAWGIGAEQWKQTDDQQSLSALRTALECGCTFIDTALAYGDGHSEQLIARVLSDWKRRVSVATKVPPKNDTWPALKGIPLREVFPADYVKRCAETSAKNLGRPIDLLQLHVWRDEWLDEKDWAATEKTIAALIAAGTVKAFGISINDHDPGSALRAVKTCQLVTSVQVIYNVFDQSPAKELFPLCSERKVGVIARVPLDEGGLTGNVLPETHFEPGDFRAAYFESDERRRELVEHVAALKPLLLEQAGSLAEGAIRFCLSHPAVSTVIPGMRTVEHAKANCALGDGHALTPALLQRLEAHAWPRDWYPVPKPPRRGFRIAGIVGLLSLVLWIVLGFVIPLGAGWVHLFLPVALLLLVRDVVTGPAS